ncbi:DUF3137 domain-containing protein [Salinibacillus xinjiangensis]|uniref:DUF3137 domain-containing protein n=1 Tax=Salinibacillus xinjiangensis TaxID=1229268 RepID=A0A6G1X8A0_9BACI|nr:DUF3137 domain-containing protein [Salinibacillus xinjiangensis]MRG87159.1 DUF3137 domain-containing protein [Salinibacillus xinjiangensis]
MSKLSKTQKEFDQFFEENLKSEIDRLEDQRLQLKQRRNKQLIFFLIAAIPPIVIAQLVPKWYSVLCYVITVVIIGIGFSKIGKTYDKFGDMMKQKIVKEIVSFINPNFTYEPGQHIPESTFQDTGIFENQYNEYNGDDLIYGEVYKGHFHRTQIAFSEVEALHVESDRSGPDHDTNTVHKSVVFQGLFFEVEFDKHFKGTTIIHPNEKKSKQFQFKKFNIFRKHPELTEIDLGHEEFHESFTVKTNDEFQAKTLLTHDFIDELLTFIQSSQEKATNRIKHVPDSLIKKVVPYFSFKDGKMYFLHNTLQNHFEFDLNKKPDQKLIYSFFEDINQALKLIEDINIQLHH